ncbi:hypothetical protein QOZ80_8BG0656770 [Eleusine coracana subsp. coracana]|nr:hypothetical protein QOZ80_8BG0656770 [Eleusine coracana subsp. coracana]
MTPLLILCFLPLAGVAAGSDAVSSDMTTLLAVNSALSDPDAALSGWDPRASPSPCQWPHLLCSNNRSDASDAIVASLLLSNLSLAGEFPTPLCSLRSLTRLDLSYNSLSGPLPACLATALPSLTHLDLAGNAFSGAVPARYGAFPSLSTLSLAGNELSGPFPSFLLTNATNINWTWPSAEPYMNCI